MAISALRRVCIPFLVVAVTIALLALSSGNAKAVPPVPSFDPDFNVKLCNDLPTDFKGPAEIQGGDGACVPDTSPSGHPDITIPFLVPRGDLAYDQSNFVSYGGANETRLAGPVGPPAGGPNGDGTGAPAGGLESSIMLGLAANACDSPLKPQFIWWDSETDITETVPCQPEGLNDRWSNLASDGDDAWAGQADADSPIVTKFPDCMVKLFDPDGDGIDTDSDPTTLGDQPVAPHWRGAGLTKVSGNWQMLQNFEFAPGVLAAAFSANPNTSNHPYAKLTADLGYINVIQLNDPTTVILEPNPISDFCTDLGTQGMIKGQIDTDGDTTPDVDRITSPATAGSYLAGARTQSYRDADGDGIENNFDTCAWTANTDDPYTDPGADYDMLDPACDPFPLAKVDDEDADTYLNPQDWCPLVTNRPPTVTNPGPGETDDENNQVYNVGAPDGGPRQDSIGDDCDGVVSGENPSGLGNPIVSDGLFFNALYIDSVCIEGDYDASRQEDGDNLPDAGPPAQCGDTLDNDGDTLTDADDPDCATVDNDDDGWCSDIDGVRPGSSDAVADDIGGTFSLEMPLTVADTTDTDTDPDGLSDWYEWRIGTDPMNDCRLIKGHDAWRADIYPDGVINLVDLNKLLPPPLGVWGGTPLNALPYLVRRDIGHASDPSGNGPDGVINLVDLNQILPPPLGSWGATCP